MPEPVSPTSMIADVRAASRDLVRQLGLMNRTVAGTDLSLSAVHAMIEIGIAGRLSSKQLGKQLLLEKSTVSRLVKSLVDRGEISEARSQNDGRIKHLQLTTQGRRTFALIKNVTDAQVGAALDRLDPPSQQTVLAGLRDYVSALKSASGGSPHPGAAGQIEVGAGHVPGLIGSVVAMLHQHMHAHYGFGLTFERRIASDMVEFMSRIEEPGNSIWRAEDNGRIVGSISIDGHHSDQGYAHLRWFVVDAAARGAGVGRQLLSHALAYCDTHGYPETHLWTVKGLDAARALYEKAGFVLADEYQGDQWGTSVTEQKFVRR